MKKVVKKSAAIKKSVKSTPSKAVKKAVKKKVAKKTTKKKVAKQKVIEIAAKTEFTGDGRRKTLRTAQVAILKKLKANPNGLTRSKISDSVAGNMGEHLGSIKDVKNAYTVSLLEHKYVKMEQHDVNDKDTVIYTITKLGLNVLNRL